MLKVVSIFDRASQLYGRPAFVPHVGSSIRDFSDEVNRSAQDNPLFKHPEDFDLYVLCDFDEDKGMFIHSGDDSPSLLIRGKDAVRKE